MNDYIPPHNLEAEMSVLGSMMLYDRDGQSAAIDTASEALSPSDFYRDSHCEIFTAMVALNSRAEPVDIVTLKAELDRRGTLDRIGGVGYLMQIGDIAFTSATLPHYAKIVRDKSQRRRFLELLDYAQNLAALPEAETPDLFSDFEKRLSDLNDDNRQAQSSEMVEDVLQSALCDFADYAANRGKLTGISSGFPDLDSLTSGFQRGYLIIVAGRPSMGKSAISTQMFADMCASGQSPVFASLEMSRAQIGRRMACTEARVDALLAHKGMAGRAESEKFRPMLERFRNCKGLIDDAPKATLSDIDSLCRRHRAKYGLDAVFVDYLQLVSPAGKGRGDRNSEIGEIAEGLKAMARKYEVPVIALSQLSRSVEKREDKHPMLSDLRDSGAIEAAADLVLFPFRPEYYVRKVGTDDAHMEYAELMIAKNRNGPTGTVPLGWWAKHVRFDTVVPEFDPKGVF